MIVTVLFSSFLLFFIKPIACGYFKNVGLGDCVVIPLSIYNCEDGDGYLDWSITLKNIDDNGGKALDLIANLEERLTGDYIVNIKIDSFSNGNWKDDMYNLEGDICSYLTTYVPKAWKNLRERLVPPVYVECDIDPGHYEVRDLQFDASDLDIPVTLFGKFRVTTKLFNLEEELCACKVGELEVNVKRLD